MSPKKKIQKSDSQGCELVFCEDPQSGDLIIRPKGDCPPGYMERLRDKALAEGVTFIIPKVHTRQE